MRWYGPLGRAALAWRSVAGASVQFSTWEAPLVLAATRGIVLLLLAGLAMPGLAAASQPLVRALGGDGALHYPQLYLRLPTMLDRAELALTLSIAVIAQGAAVLRFAGCFAHRSETRAWRDALRATPSLILLALSLVLLAGLADRAFREFDSAAIAAGLSFCLEVALRAFFCYAVAATVLRRFNPLRASASAWQVIRRGPVTTLILVGIPSLFLEIVRRSFASWNPLHSGQLPETMLVALSAEIVLQLLIGFVIIGSTTRFFLARTEVDA